MEIHLENMRHVHHRHTFYKQFHSHDLCELAYYVSGRGTVSREGTLFPYGKGTIHLVHNGVVHDENNETESRIILLYFQMPQEYLPSGIYEDRSGVVLALLRKLRFELAENLQYKQQMVDCILMQILLVLKRKLFPSPVENKNFNRIVRYIDENFQSEIDMHKIAAQAFLSYDRFRHIFKDHTGYAPHEYIAIKRIDLAKYLIDIDPSISLTSLAAECGYKNLSQFSNSFRSKTNMTPSQYKNTVVSAAKKKRSL